MTLYQAKRIVLKLGTNVVMAEGKISRARLSSFVKACARWNAEGREVLLVSSGAVGLGRTELKLHQKNLSLQEKQACAAVGQGLLMEAYRKLFARSGLSVAQILLTAGDFSTRERYINLSNTLEQLLKLGVVPIINENDTVSTMELSSAARQSSFGDNDKLSSLVAAKLGAQLLVILTSVDGIYSDNPEMNPSARLLTEIHDFEALAQVKSRGQSAYGRGGMSSKVEAARVAAISGVTTVVTNGLRRGVLDCLLESKLPGRWKGTVIHPQKNYSKKRQWIGLAAGFSGVLCVNQGAAKALIEKGASLLPSGVVSCSGNFKANDVVSIKDEGGKEIARGIVKFSTQEVSRIAGRKTKEIEMLLGYKTKGEVVHRDDLVVFEEGKT